MKTLKVFVLAFVVGFSALANHTPEETLMKQLKNEIHHLLEHPNIVVTQSEINAIVEFTLNTKGEVIVLTVDSDNDSLESYVKSKLNYKKIAQKVLTSGQVYKIRLRVLNPTT